jgi:hypothetical protein
VHASAGADPTPWVFTWFVRVGVAVVTVVRGPPTTGHVPLDWARFVVRASPAPTARVQYQVWQGSNTSGSSSSAGTTWVPVAPGAQSAGGNGTAGGGWLLRPLPGPWLCQALPRAPCTAWTSVQWTPSWAPALWFRGCGAALPVLLVPTRSPPPSRATA